MILHFNLQRIARQLLLRICLPILSASGGNLDLSLHVDGRVNVKGSSIEGTRVTIARDGKVMQVLTDDLGRIGVKLDLQRTYLFSFERTGCMTKQLFFNTSVPQEALENAPFNFLFKVTLQAIGAESTLRYGQPVGHIRYYEEIGDFDYDKDYAMLRDPDPVDPPIAATPLVEIQPEQVEPEQESIDEEPMISLAAPQAGGSPEALVEAPAFPAPPAARARRMRPSLVDPTLALGELAREASNDAAEASTAPGARKPAAPRPKPASMDKPRSRPISPAPAPIIYPEGRSEETVVEKLRITRIVRLTNSGHTTEYRRVQTKYGPVYYFKNGISCSEKTYAESSCER